MPPEKYQVKQPVIPIYEYWKIAFFLLASVLTPVVVWLIWRDSDLFGRSGSLMVFFAAMAEFLLIGRANRKHILNACRAKNGETPWDFSRTDKGISIIAFLLALVGTVIWGFGDLMLTN